MRLEVIGLYVEFKTMGHGVKTEHVSSRYKKSYTACKSLRYRLVLVLA